MVIDWIIGHIRHKIAEWMCDNRNVIDVSINVNPADRWHIFPICEDQINRPIKELIPHITSCSVSNLYVALLICREGRMMTVTVIGAYSTHWPSPYGGVNNRKDGSGINKYNYLNVFTFKIPCGPHSTQVEESVLPFIISCLCEDILFQLILKLRPFLSFFLHIPNHPL